MRINSNTHPVLATLESKQYMHVLVDAFLVEKGLRTDILMALLAGIHGKASKRYYITEPFQEALDKAYPKIISDNKHMQLSKKECGITITATGFSLYSLNPYEDTKLITLGFHRHQGLTCYAIIKSDGSTCAFGASLKDGKPFNDVTYAINYGHSILTLLYFIENCEIETYVAPANSKTRYDGNKFLNETKSNLTLLTCKWFTELIRDTPFNVSGHLRWQPCGVNRTKKKLIYISEYQKSGYHRKPQKLEA